MPDKKYVVRHKNEVYKNPYLMNFYDRTANPEEAVSSKTLRSARDFLNRYQYFWGSWNKLSEHLEVCEIIDGQVVGGWRGDLLQELCDEEEVEETLQRYNCRKVIDLCDKIDHYRETLKELVAAKEIEQTAQLRLSEAFKAASILMSEHESDKT